MTIVFTLAVVAVGVVCLTKAPAMQRRLIRSLDEGRGFQPFPKYVRSRTYIHVTRVIGILCLLVAAFLIAMLMRGNLTY